MSVSEEPLLLRAGQYLETRTQDGSFCDAVRRRDTRCVITDDPVRVAQAGRWKGFDSRPVFPLAYKGNWKAIEYDGLSDPLTNESDTYCINSVRGERLLNCSIPCYFDAYSVTINHDVEIVSSSSFRSYNLGRIIIRLSAWWYPSLIQIRSPVVILARGSWITHSGRMMNSYAGIFGVPKHPVHQSLA